MLLSQDRAMVSTAMRGASAARVLVVDDEPAVREALRRALALEGYSVDLAENGAEALRKVGPVDPDVVVLDVLMPEVDGLAACRRLRAEGNRVPVLLLTAPARLGDPAHRLAA